MLGTPGWMSQSIAPSAGIWVSMAAVVRGRFMGVKRYAPSPTLARFAGEGARNSLARGAGEGWGGGLTDLPLHPRPPQRALPVRGHGIEGVLGVLLAGQHRG